MPSRDGPRSVKRQRWHVFVLDHEDFESLQAAGKESDVATTMRSTIAWCVALMMIGISACNGDTYPSEFEEKPMHRFAPSDSEYYGPPEPALKQLLDGENKNGARNEFCVVGYAYAGKIVNVWVHWINEQRLLLWRGNSDEELREQGLVMARRDLRLGEDTVETEDDIKGSTFLVTHAWWHAVTQDCAANGERYTIERFRRK